MDLDPGDVLLIEVQFHQKPGAKIRPAIAVLSKASIRHHLGKLSARDLASVRGALRQAFSPHSK